MGNVHARGARKFLEPEPVWNDYYTAEWRSDRSKELDRHGGPGRPPVARGDSVTAKLVFLEGALRQDQRRMKQVLQVFDDEAAKREQAIAQRGHSERLPDFILNTDLRAYERLVSGDGQREEDGGPPLSGQHRDFSVVAKDPEMRKKMMEQRKKMLEYAKGVNVTKGAPAIKPLNLPAIKSKVASSWRNGEEGAHGEDEEGGGASGDGQHWHSNLPAEWRLRMHQARRRTMLLVAAMARWQLAMSKRPGPKRLPRVNSFSYYIPQVLGDEAKRFIEEATVVAKVKADLEPAEEQRALDSEHERQSSEDRSPQLQPPGRASTTGQQTAAGAASASAPGAAGGAAAAANGGRAGPGTPDRLAHGAPRRGNSDSGYLPPEVAAAAVGAAVAEVTGGGGAAGPLASGMVRPKKRPELRKSSSLHAGHSSDVEGYSAPRRLYSSKGAGSMRLPAIGAGRVSSSGVAGHDAAAYPHYMQGPRQPRAGKLSRISSSSGQGRAAAARRQSDGYLAAGLPPGIAAAAAAGAAVLAAASSGGSAAASRIGSAAVLDRHRRGGGVAGPRSRVSETGVSRLRRDGSESVTAAGGAAGSSPFMENLRQSLTGLPGAGGMPSPRRSEAGAGMASAASAPPESPSAGAAAAAAAGGGFLPRISSTNTVAGTAPSSAGSVNGNGKDSKPMTLAQARRLALMAEVGSASGSEDPGQQRNNVAMSPSRLGPLKLGGANGSSNGSGSSRSPDKLLPLGSPAAGGAGSSILDGAAALRSSREGGLLAGGNRELREALAGMSASSAAGSSSPINSPASASAAANDGSTDGSGPPPVSPTVPIIPPAHPPALLRPLVAAPSPPPPAASSGAAAGPPGKPPVGPSGERVRSGRSNSTAAGAAAGGGSAADDDPRVAKAQQLMSMYANRVNAMWAESQQWVAPTVLSVPEQEMFCASDAYVPYKVTVQRLLRGGSIAVHIDACADAVQLPDGTLLDLWTTDPWVMAQRLRPGSLPLSERIEGLSLGARVLQQLVLAVEALAGREAVARLTVVLALNDDQRNAVVADIIRRRWYGLKPENLVLTAQRKRYGYRYDKDAQAFLEDPSTTPQVLGSGFALCQLAWLGDAFSVTRDGELSMLMGRTLLERFADGRVEWLVGRRARDLALLTAEGVLDVQHLSFCLYAADRHNGNMVLQVAPASSVTIPRAYDSTILALKPGTTVNPRPGSSSSSVHPPTPARVATIAASAAGVEGNGGAAGVMDLRAAELSSPVMVEALAAVRKQAGHDGWVGLQRFVIHVPTLHGLLNTLNVFRPKLAMSGDVARLSLDLGDITADRRVACVAVHARTSPAILNSPNEVDDLIPLLQAQDHSATFRDIISTSTSNDPTAADAGGGAAGGGADAASGTPAAQVLATKPGIRILLFVAANEVTQLAVNLVLLMARPGRDVVHLVTVVHNSLQMPTGQALLVKYLKQITNSMIEAHSEVVVKGMSGLLEVMEAAAAKLSPNLVVMASAALTMSNLNTASVMGSVTLSVLKRLSLPVAVATSNSKNLVLTQRRTALRCMVLVDATSRPALNFLCSSCMEPMRGDKLVLAGHHPTRQMTTQQQQTQRRLIDNFADIASSHRFHSPNKLQLDGPVDKALSTAADEESVHLVGVQVPLGTKGVPGNVLGLIRACKGGVLVFRDTL